MGGLTAAMVKLGASPEDRLGTGVWAAQSHARFLVRYYSLKWRSSVTRLVSARHGRLVGGAASTMSA